MENLSLFSKAPSSSSAIIRPFLPPISSITRTRTLSFSISRRPLKFSVSAAKDDGSSINDKLSQSDLMELKFGQMLGEDPKLTLAKIMHRKVDPDASYLEIEKNFYRNKGKIVEIKEVPFDAPRKGQSGNATNGLNLVRPVPKEGFAVGRGDDPASPEKKQPGASVGNEMRNGHKSSVPNVILRKPSMYGENDDNVENSSRIQIRPNLSLKMRTEPVKEKFDGMTLLKKPEPASSSKNDEEKQDNSTNVEAKDLGVDKNKFMDTGDQNENSFEESSTNGVEQASGTSGTITMLKKPIQITQKNGDDGRVTGTHLEGLPESGSDFESVQEDLGMQPPELSDRVSSLKENGIEESPSTEFASSICVESTLQGKPNRLGQPVKVPPDLTAARSSHLQGSGGDGQEENSPLTLPLNEVNDDDWARAEELFTSGDRGEVELISCSSRGFAVSFGSLIGFLPYRNLAAKWKFLAFESWLRKKGLDPSKYRQNLGIIGNSGVLDNKSLLESSSNSEAHQYTEIEVPTDMELEDLLRIYDQEKIKFLSSFVGQRIKVNVLLADKKSRRLIFSARPREKEETVEKKRSLMRNLGIGDVVKCTIKKITYFGIFVEVEGVPALIHQSEVSWDATLDPASYYKIGQIVEAKVHQLDFTLERIFLSLKEITPDPMMETLESVIGDNNSLDGILEASRMDTEWAEVDALIKELQAIGGVQAVTKGRFFLSPGLAPTFQVYMASMFENQYKLLARSGNKVQEVMVQASLGKEEMKSVILTCTNKVE